MKDRSRRRTRLQAVVLSLIVVVSVFGGTAALATPGPATPAQAGESVADSAGPSLGSLTDGTPVAADERPTAGTLAATDWPEFQGNPANTGQNDGSAPKQGISELWSTEVGSGFGSSAAVVGDTAYVGNADNNLYAFDTTDGSIRWQVQNSSHSFDSSPAVADGTVYVGNDDNYLYAVDAGTGTIEWSFQAEDDVASSPTVVDGTVYVGSGGTTNNDDYDDKVYALDADTGNLEWEFSTGAEIRRSSPAVVDDRLYIGNTDGDVYALNATDGTEIWKYSTGDTVWGTPAVSDGTVYVGSWDDNVYALDATDGTEEWTFTTGGPVWASPAVSGGTVYVGSLDTNMYAIDADDGTEQWRFVTSDGIKSSAAVVDGAVYFGSSAVFGVDATDGTELWNFTADTPGEQSPAVVEETVYIGLGFSFYAITGSSTGTGTLSGAVTDDDTGDGIGNAAITAYQGGNLIDSTTTDANGQYSLALEPGDYHIEADADGYQSLETSQVTITEDETTTESFPLRSLDSTGTLEGTVTDSTTGDALAGAIVSVSQNGKLVNGTTTGPNGEFSFELATGDYAFFVGADNYQDETFVGLTVSEDSVTTKDVQLTPEGSMGALEGTVTDADTGDPIEGATVAVAQNGNGVAETTTDANGDYSFTLEPGDYDVQADADGYETKGIPDVTVSEDSTTTQDIQLTSQGSTGTLEGTVTDADTGDPIEGAEVGVAQDGQFVDGTTTDANGQYSLSLPPGDYDVQVEDENYQTNAEGGVTVNEDATTTLDFQLSPVSDDPGTITGTVTEAATGDPLEGVQVVAFSHATTKATTTDASGEYSFDLSAGNYTIGVTSQAYVDEFRQDVGVDAGATTTVNFDLQTGGTVTGTVTDADTGDPVANAIVMLDGPGSYFAQTNADGEYTRKVPEGEYTVTAFGQGDTIAKQGGSVSVSEGSTATQDLELVSPSIGNMSISYLGGSGDPQMDQISVESQFQFGSLQIFVRNDATQTPQGMPDDLANLGVLPDDRFEITFTVDGFDPSTLLWGVKNVSWSSQDNGDGSYDVTVRTETITMAGIQDQSLPIGPLQGKSPEEIAWPEGEDDVADLTWNRTVFFSLMDMSHIPSDRIDQIEGMTIATNAQTFSRPRLVETEGPNGETTEQLEVYLGAPSKTVSGESHGGFYEAFIPDDILDDWNVTDPATEIQALYKGQDKAFEVEETSDGVWIHLDIDYSDGEVELGAGEQSSFEVTALDPENATVSEGQNFSVSANLTNTGEIGGERDVELRLEPDGTAVRTKTVQVDAGETRTVTFQDVAVDQAGTYNHTIVAGAGQQSGSLNVTESTGSVAFAVSNLQADNANFTQNDGATAVAGAGVLQVTATVENVGDAPDTQTVEFRFDGGVQATKTVQLDAGNTTTVTFTVTAPDVAAGNYTHGVFTVGDSATTTVEILPAVAVSGSPARDTTGDGLLNDVDGDGSFDIFDVQVLFGELGTQTLDDNAQYFDFNEDESSTVDIFDVQSLFGMV